MRPTMLAVALAAAGMQLFASVTQAESFGVTRKFEVAGSQISFVNPALSAGLSLGSPTTSVTAELNQVIPFNFDSLPAVSTRFLAGRVDSLTVSGSIRMGVNFSYPTPASAPTGPSSAVTSGSLSFATSGAVAPRLTLSAQTSAGTCPPSCGFSYNELHPVSGHITLNGPNTPSSLTLTSATASSIGNDPGYTANVGFTGGQVSTLSTFTYVLPAYRIENIAFNATTPGIAAATSRRVFNEDNRLFASSGTGQAAAYNDHKTELWLASVRGPDYSEVTPSLLRATSNFSGGIAGVVNVASTSADYWSGVVGLASKGLGAMLATPRHVDVSGPYVDVSSLPAERPIGGPIQLDLPGAPAGNNLAAKAIETTEHLLNAMSFVATARVNAGVMIEAPYGPWDLVSGGVSADEFRSTIRDQYREAGLLMSEAANSLREFAALIGEDQAPRSFTRYTYDQYVAAFARLQTTLGKEAAPQALRDVRSEHARIDDFLSDHRPSGGIWVVSITEEFV